MFPTSGGPLLRELMAEDREESIMGRTFILSHTGTARDTSYKFREVRVPKQTAILKQDDEEEEENEDQVPEAIPDVNEQEAKAKEKFTEEVKKRTAKRKTKKVAESQETAEPVT